MKIAVTLDLEMSRHYPKRGMTRWDYEKGNLDEASKEYTLRAARRLKEAGGVLNAFVLGRTLEQENVDWLLELIDGGHQLGNHTYDHVKLVARSPETLQFRFKRAPWLLRGMPVEEAIVDNIKMAEEAMRTRLKVTPVGFCCPYGFPDGLTRRPDLQRMLHDLGYRWVISHYREAAEIPRTGPGAREFGRIAKNVAKVQPYRYPIELVELPIGCPTDVMVFRSRRWKLDEFVAMVERCCRFAIERDLTFHFASHPSCLGVVDPELKTIGRICEIVEESGKAARLATLTQIAKEVEGK